jgi:phage-related protein
VSEVVEKGLEVRSFISETESLAGSIHNVGQTMIDLGTDAQGTTKTVQLAQTAFKGVGDITAFLADKSQTAAIGVFKLQTAFNNAAPIVGQFGALGKTINAGFEITGGFLAKFSDRLGLISNATLKASESFQVIQDNFPAFAKGLEMGGKFIQSFATIIGGIGKDLGNLPGIFKALVAEVPPLVGKFGQAIGTITAMSGALFGLGTMLVKSDSTMGKVAGGSMIALALATGGILVAVKALTAAIGDFVTGAGMKLFTLFDHGIEAAIADEAATESLARTVTRLSSSAEEGAARLQSWHNVIEDLGHTAKFAGSEAELLAAQVTRMGQEFSLTQRQQEELTQAVAVFAQNGQEATEITDAIRMSFLGTGKQAEELGIHVNDLAVNNSEYARSINKVAGNMTKQEIVTAKLALVLAQAAATTELLTGHNESLAQVQHKVKVAQEEIDAQFAQGSIPIYQFFAEQQLKVLMLLERMPQGMKNAISSATAYAGSLLIVVGTMMKWSFIVAGTIGLVATLNAVLAQSATAQAILTTAFTITNTAMGAQVVAVTGLSTVFQNLVLLIKGSMITALKAVGTAFLTTARAVGVFTMSILTNPLFIAGAAIAAGVYLVVRAVSELREQLTFLKGSADDAGKAVDAGAKSASVFAKAWSGVTAVLEGVVRVAVSLTKIIVSGLIADVVGLQMVYYKLRAAVASNAESQQKWQKEIATSRDYLTQLKGAVMGAGVEIAGAFDSTAKAAEKTADKIKGVDLAISNFRRSISLVKSDPIQDAYLKTSVLGTTFEKAKADYESANFAFAKAFDTLNSSQDQSKESIDGVNKAREEAAKTFLNMLKVQQDALKDFKKSEQEANVQALKDAGELRRAAELEGASRLKEFDKTAEGIRLISGLTRDQIKTIEAARKAIEDRNAADVTKAAGEEAEKVAAKSKKYAEDAAKAQEEPLKKYQEMLDKFKALGDAEKYKGMTALEAADAEFEANVKAVNMLEAQLAATQALFPERQRQLNQIREMIELQKKNAKDGADMQVGDLGAMFAGAAKSVKGIFSGDENKTFLESVKGAGASMMRGLKEGAGTLITAIKQVSLKDIGEGIIEGAKAAGEVLMGILSGSLIEDFANLVDQIGNFPNAMLAAFSHLDQAITSAISKLPEMLSRFLERFPEILKKITDALPKFIQMIAKAIPQIVQAIVKEAPAFTKALMAALPALIDGIVDAVVMLVESIPEILRKILEGLPKIILSILKGLGKIIGAIVKAIPEIIRAIVDNIPEIIQALIEGILGAVGEIAAAFVDATIDEMTSGKMLSSILKMIPKIVMAIVQGIGKGLYDIWKKLWGSISGIKAPKGLADLPKNIANGASKLSKQIAKDASKIFAVKDLEDSAKSAQNAIKTGDVGGVISDAFKKGLSLWEKMWELVKKPFIWIRDHIWRPFWDGIKAMWEGITGALKELWDNIYDHIIEPLITIHKKAFKWVYDNIVEPLKTIGQKAFQWVYDKIVEPLMTIGQKGFQWVYDNILSPMITFVEAAWAPIKDFFSNIFKGNIKEAFEGAFKPITDFFGGDDGLFAKVGKAFKPITDLFSGEGGFMSTVKAAFKPITDLFGSGNGTIGERLKLAAGDLWQGIKDQFTNGVETIKGLGGTIWEGLKGALGKVGDTFKNLGSGIWDGLKGALGNVGDTFKNLGSGIYDGLKNALGGLGEFLKGIFDKLSPANLFSKIFSIPDSAWGKGTVEEALSKIGGSVDIPWLKFATGGVVPGSAAVAGDSPMNDRILAMLSPGEAVIPRSAMNDPNVRGIVQQIMDGSLKLPQYYLGEGLVKKGQNLGILPTPSNPIPGVTGPAPTIPGLPSLPTPGEMWKIVKGKVNDAVMEIFSHNAFAEGGWVGGNGTRDTVPAMLTPGEFVVNRKSAGMNAAFLSALNAGGGTFAGGGGRGGTSVHIDKIEINSTAPLDKAMVKRDIVPTILEEIKKKSQSGQFIIAAPGVRS